MNDECSRKFNKIAVHAVMVCLAVLSVFMIHSIAYAEPEKWFIKCIEYEQMVKDILKSEGVSEEFYYLMVAESHCTDDAESDQGAVGYWQMLPRTMKHYGCSDSSDLECQTRAAARYIHRLSKEFKSFNDIVAAWNMGGHNLKTQGKNQQAKNLVYTVTRIKKGAVKYMNMPSTVVVDDKNECIYWYFDDEPDEKIPCLKVPDGAVKVLLGSGEREAVSTVEEK